MCVQHLLRSRVIPCLIVLCGLRACDAAGEFPRDEWEKASREQMQRWSVPALDKAEAYWKTLGSTAVMVVEDGTVIRAWGNVEQPIQCYSVRKSFLSVLFGIYRQKGQINLNATMAQLKIDDVPPRLTAEEKKQQSGTFCRQGPAFTIRPPMRRNR